MPADNTTQQEVPRTQAVIEAELEAIQSARGDVDLPPDSEEAHDAAETAKLQAENTAIESASKRGWAPRDQYKGEPGKWVDAKTFLERGDRFASNLQRENADLRKKISSFEGTQKAFKSYMEGVMQQKDVQLTSAIAELRIQRSAAIREGDDTGAIAIEDRIDLLKDQQKTVKDLPKDLEEEQEAAATPAGPNTNDPVVDEWIEDGNQWFKEDPALQAYAVAMGNKLIKEGETVKGRRFLDKVSEAMRQEFPRRFRKLDEAAGKPTTPRSPVESTAGRSTTGTGAAGGKTERDLPVEDLALMKQFVKEGWVTREKFLKDYFTRN